jgi:LmbE family N-acetylglucosaminyl deacetylase
MYAAANEWRNDALFVNGHVISSSTLVARPSIRLVFIRLPDGRLDGRGFGRGGLQQLWSGATPSLASVDSANSYSRNDLVRTLRALLQSASPRIVRAMDFRPAPNGFGSGDHSDHVATAYLTEAALGAGNPALKGYLGYLAVAAGPENVRDPLLHAKTDAFMTYAKYDSAIRCKSFGQCGSQKMGGSYSDWLPRQYVIP